MNTIWPNSLVSFILSFLLLTYSPTYLHPTYISWALCQYREKAKITIHSRTSQSIFSLCIQLFHFSCLKTDILMWRTMCFASFQSFWDETFSEPLSCPLEVSPGSREFFLRFRKLRNLLLISIQCNWCSYLIVNILILAICSDLSLRSFFQDWLAYFEVICKSIN